MNMKEPSMAEMQAVAMAARYATLRDQKLPLFARYKTVGFVWFESYCPSRK